MAFTADVSQAAEVEAMVAACLKAYGRIDVLDNNVGIAEMGSVVEVTEANGTACSRSISRAPFSP